MANLVVQNLTKEKCPSETEFNLWVDKILAEHLDYLGFELTLRLVDLEEITLLNKEYRGTNQATNVLSFPFDMPSGIEGLPLILGDIVICAAVVEAEAKVQGKALKSHWMHMTVHGVLHLLGYDHVNNEEAELMESLEIEILAKLGVNNPYL